MYQQASPLGLDGHHQHLHRTGSEAGDVGLGDGVGAHLVVAPVEGEGDADDKEYSVDTPGHLDSLLGPDQFSSAARQQK